MRENGQERENDERWMAAALGEARKGIGLTSPNPPVGAVVVRGGEVVGKGFHAKAGEAHAEVAALADVQARGNVPAGATLYLTLEPCSTHGRTPPCCDSSLAAGLGRVVYAVADPNPAHAGRADAVLSEAGIAVESGIGADAARVILRPFARRVTTGLPWVIAKAGMSLDGKIARPRGETQWLTGEAARADAHRLRSTVDAIVVGAGTVRADDPALTVRGPAFRIEKEQPWRVVLTRSGELPANARVLTDEHKARTRVYSGEALETILRDLVALGCNAVLVEGGGEVLGEFFAAGLVDEVVCYVAPLWCGAGDGTVPVGGAVELGASVELDGLGATVMGDGSLRVQGLVVRP
ncbi:bifunctional diaminohydroxyphosphoribosylaminopyrimidine deaminase/5-amino-6-(5-phosphoribosylamino)uracil reductase RibD [soil metagenome]